MSGHPKEPCEICGKEITTMVMAREAHMVACRKKHADKVAGIVNEPDTPAETEVSKKPEKISEDPKIQADYERSLKASENRRKAAPGIVANPVQQTDALTEREIHLKGLGIITKHDHPFWGDITKHNQYISNGYVPAIEKGAYTDHGENRLYKLPKIAHYAEEKRHAAESRQRIDSQKQKGDSTIHSDNETDAEDSLRISQADAKRAATEAREAGEAEMLAQMNG